MRRAILVTAMPLMLALGPSIIGLAAAGSGDPAPRPFSATVERGDDLLRELSLTQAQREKLAALQERKYRETVPLMARMQEAIFQYKQIRLLKPDDAAILRTRRQAIEKAQQALRQKAAEFRAEFKQILTSAQQEKVRDLGREKWDGSRGHHGPGF